jgi:hypothetical protein
MEQQQKHLLLLLVAQQKVKLRALIVVQKLVEVVEVVEVLEVVEVPAEMVGHQLFQTAMIHIVKQLKN